MPNYDFVVFYLEHLVPYYGDIKEYFLKISKEEFESKFK